jgi:adenylate kinase family enzyme
VPVQFPYKRICVVGTSAAGKTTLSRALSERLDIPHIELDALFHGPNWQQAPDGVFRERVHSALAAERWICDGNYLSKAGQLQMAELVIFLNYSFRVVFTRVIRRTLKRLLTHEDLWNGNRESWRMLFSKESIVWWMITTHRRRQSELPKLLAKEAAVSLIFTHPRQARKWLERL